jgi:hypothetical protein
MLACLYVLYRDIKASYHVWEAYLVLGVTVVLPIMVLLFLLVSVMLVSVEAGGS